MEFIQCKLHDDRNYNYSIWKIGYWQKDEDIIPIKIDNVVHIYINNSNENWETEILLDWEDFYSCYSDIEDYWFDNCIKILEQMKNILYNQCWVDKIIIDIEVNYIKTKEEFDNYW